MAEELNLVILFNTRSIVSLVGILLIVYFGWQWDRKWESQGKLAGNAENEDTDPEKPSSDYEPMGSSTEGEDDNPKTSTKSNVPSTIPLAFAGWVLLGFSNLLPRRHWLGFEATRLEIASCLILCFLGWVHSSRIPTSIVERKFTQKKGLWNALMIGGMVADGFITFWEDRDAPLFASTVGGLCIVIAPIIMWQNRLAGDTLDMEGRMNPKPVLYNFGGPLLVFGWFWFWIGMNVCYYYPGAWEAYVHVGTGIRMFLAFLGGITIILNTWLVGYALDELENLSGERETSSGLLQASAFGMNGYFCGYVYEIKVATIISWAPIGLAMFFPYIWGDYSDWLLLLSTIAMGYCMAMVQENGFRMLSSQNVDLWVTRSYAPLAFIAILIPIQHGSHYFAFVLSAIGAVAFGFGMQYLYLDQKRGKKWLESQAIQEPNVFSYGALLAPLGALTLSWAVTMHP